MRSIGARELYRGATAIARSRRQSLDNAARAARQLTRRARRQRQRQRSVAH